MTKLVYLTLHCAYRKNKFKLKISDSSKPLYKIGLLKFMSFRGFFSGYKFRIDTFPEKLIRSELDHKIVSENFYLANACSDDGSNE